METEEKFMEEAIDIAKRSAEQGDYSVGALVVQDGKIISRGTTMLKHENDPTVHGEIVAIRRACDKLGSRYLENCVLYSTHEPCPMCASAAVWSKMKGIVFGATIEDAEKHHSEDFSWRQIRIKCREVVEKGTPKPEVVEGFLRKRCLKLFEMTE